MNGSSNTYVTVDRHGEARMDFEHFQDDEDDGLTFGEIVSSPVSSDITPATGRIEVTPTSGRIVVDAQVGLFDDPKSLFGAASSSSSATGTLITEPKAADEPLLAPEEPPGILWSPIAKTLMSPRQYISEWLPNIADMHFEYDQRLKRGDRLGALWAVVRAHYYSLPRWLLLIPGAFILNKLRHWLGF